MLSIFKRHFSFKTIKIEDDLQKRLDVFLINSGKNLSWGKAHSLIKNKLIFVKNEEKKKVYQHSYILRTNDSIFIKEQEFEKFFKNSPKIEKGKKFRQIDDLAYIEQMMSAMLIFKCENYLVLNKPVGMFSQGTAILKLNISSILNSYYSNFYIPKQSFIVHRLDKPVSGIILVATNKQYASEFSEKMKNKKVEKYYECFVQGVPKFFLEQGKIMTKISELVGFNESKQKAFIGNEKNSDVSRAICEVELLSIFKIDEKKKKVDFKDNVSYFQRIINPENQSNFISHLKFKLITGKRHQLRLFSEMSLGTPILFDFKYGYKISNKESIEQKVDDILSSDEFVHSESEKIQKYMQEIYQKRAYIYLQSLELKFFEKSVDKMINREFKAEYNAHFKLFLNIALGE